jgi:hypothetical protein
MSLLCLAILLLVILLPLLLTDDDEQNVFDGARLEKSMRFADVTSGAILILASAVGIPRFGTDGAIGVELNGKWGVNTGNDAEGLSARRNGVSCSIPSC